MTLKVGDVLHLAEDLSSDIPAGLWCIADLRWGGITDLNRMGTDEDGHPCVTRRRATVTLQELECFVPMAFNIQEDATAEEQE